MAMSLWDCSTTHTHTQNFNSEVADTETLKESQLIKQTHSAGIGQLKRFAQCKVKSFELLRIIIIPGVD